MGSKVRLDCHFCIVKHWSHDWKLRLAPQILISWPSSFKMTPNQYCAQSHFWFCDPILPPLWIFSGMVHRERSIRGTDRQTDRLREWLAMQRKRKDDCRGKRGGGGGEERKKKRKDTNRWNGGWKRQWVGGYMYGCIDGKMPIKR